MFKKIIKFLFLFLVLIQSSKGNPLSNQSNQFFFDAVVFKGDSVGFTRVDSYFIIAYENLYFVNNDNIFAANYSINIQVRDTSGNSVTTEKRERTIKEKNYFVTQGGTAAFDYSQIRLYLKPGKYEIEATIIDNLSKSEVSRTRTITLLDYSNYPFALSGLMILNSIEESGGKFKISPHISDNIGSLDDGFFIFFESYNSDKKYDSVDYVWEIYNSGNEMVAFSNRIRKDNSKDINRIFIKIPNVKEMQIGSYLLRLIALEPVNIKEYSDKSALAIAQRSINYSKTVAGNIVANINLAVRQLRYVASRDELDYIQSAETDGERQKRFDIFWKNLDPTKGTERNEAFDEFYSRINYANQTFKSYQEGWMTDMGMVYVILGPPINVDRRSAYGDGKIYEVWTYSNNREFIFVDNSGFGDFRLVRPITVTEKYKYIR